MTSRSEHYTNKEWWCGAWSQHVQSYTHIGQTSLSPARTGHPHVKSQLGQSITKQGDKSSPAQFGRMEKEQPKRDHADVVQCIFCDITLAAIGCNSVKATF
ncbi:MAG TPA: hypothetical protein VLG16_00370 [Candidatus Saccharimonadales bacterium]|nr:hypothetical protein [Candidatus Saccharimonadales bacterium]